MTIQEANFNRCCDFLARMIEKYGDIIEVTEGSKIIIILETELEKSEKDYIIFVDYSRNA